MDNELEEQEKRQRMEKVHAIEQAEIRRNQPRTDVEVVDELFGDIDGNEETGQAPKGFEVRYM